VPIRIELADGREFLLDAALDQWEQAFQLAMSKNVALEVESPDGSVFPIDPRSVRSFREEPEGQAALAESFREAAPA